MLPTFKTPLPAPEETEPALIPPGTAIPIADNRMIPQTNGVTPHYPKYTEEFSEYLKGDLRLRPFQVEMLKKNLNAPSPIIYNASEQGLGKTCESLTYATIRGAKKLLIVCPAALQLLWVDEASKWLQPSTEFLVVSYQRLVVDKTLRNIIAKETWCGIIFDEFHYCRNAMAERTLAAIQLWNSVRMFVYLNSATPIESAAIDLFPFLTATTARLSYVSQQTKKLCSDFETFANTFCTAYLPKRGSKYGQQIQYKDVQNEDYLRYILYDECRFFFRDLRSQCLPELPPLQVTAVPITLDPKTTKSLTALTDLDDYQNFYDQNKESAHSATLRRLLGIAKASSMMFIEYTENLLLQGESLVIMAYHQEVVHSLKEQFKSWNPVTYYGEDSPLAKHHAVTAFQSGNSKVFIGNLVSASLGLTLTASANVIILEWDWNPSTIWQAVYRVLRIGQERKCTAHLIAADNTFDKHICQTQERKQNAIQKVI